MKLSIVSKYYFRYGYGFPLSRSGTFGINTNHEYAFEFIDRVATIRDATWLESSSSDGNRGYGTYSILTADMYHFGINTFIPVSFWSGASWANATIAV